MFLVFWWNNHLFRYINIWTSLFYRRTLWKLCHVTALICAVLWAMVFRRKHWLKVRGVRDSYRIIIVVWVWKVRFLAGRVLRFMTRNVYWVRITTSFFIESSVSCMLLALKWCFIDILNMLRGMLRLLPIESLILHISTLSSTSMILLRRIDISISNNLPVRSDTCVLHVVISIDSSIALGIFLLIL